MFTWGMTEIVAGGWGFVDFVIRHDPEVVFRFSPLPNTSKGLKTVLLKEGDLVLEKVFADGRRLWITHDHAPADVVIERGQCYRPGNGSRMLVHAIGNARLLVRTLQP